MDDWQENQSRAAEFEPGNVDGHAVAVDLLVFKNRRIGDSRAPICSASSNPHSRILRVQ